MKRMYAAIVMLALACGIIRAQDSSRVVLIETSYGNIRIRLYNETPVHRDNFIKLVEKGFYDSLLFHRIIPRFMIQGGDPDSKMARPGAPLGEGDVGYTLPAEFRPQLFHKRGVLAAARDGDEENPEQASSGCQFYLTQGKIFTDSMLDLAEARINRFRAYNRVVRDPANASLIRKYIDVQKQENPDSIQAVKAQIDRLIDAALPSIVPYRIPPEHRMIYKTLGGTPHLDGSYTVFGEVTEGLEVIDQIASLKRDDDDRPRKDVRMRIRILQ